MPNLRCLPQYEPPTHHPGQVRMQVQAPWTWGGGLPVRTHPHVSAHAHMYAHVPTCNRHTPTCRRRPTCAHEGASEQWGLLLPSLQTPQEAPLLGPGLALSGVTSGGLGPASPREGLRP